MAIKFNKFNVTNTETGVKARIHYSTGMLTDGREAVTLYAKDYGHALRAVFAGQSGIYQNDTDSMSDYFDQGRVRFVKADPLYPVALAAALRAA